MFTYVHVCIRTYIDVYMIYENVHVVVCSDFTLFGGGGRSVGLGGSRKIRLWRQSLGLRPFESLDLFPRGFKYSKYLNREYLVKILAKIARRIRI